jgi:hypothetical protein
MEFQAQSEFIEVKSPIDRFREQWGQRSGAIRFFQQRELIQQNPDLVQYAELAGVKGWAQPLMFALQGLVLSAFLVSALSWLITRDRGTHADAIAAVRSDVAAQTHTYKGVIESVQIEIDRIEKSRRESGFTVASSTNLTKDEALRQLNTLIEDTRRSEQEYRNRADIKIQNLRAKGDALSLAASGTPVIFALAVLFAAQLFRRFTQDVYGRNKLARQADSFYLYFVVAQGVWLNIAAVAALNVALSGSAYGLSGFIEAIGFIGAILFFLAVYGLVLFWFFLVSKDLYKAMQLPRPGNFAGLENRLLVYMHNSFWLAFMAFEAALLVLAGGVYLVEKI